MPPKAKQPAKTAATGAKNEADILRKQLQAAERRLQEEAILRNEAQVERDMVVGFWDTTRAELEASRADTRASALDAHHVAQDHNLEIKVYKQKVKHLLYEHKHNVASLKADAEGAVHTAVQAAASKQEAVMQDVHKLQAMLRDKDLEHEEIITQLKLEHAKQLSKHRLELEAQVTSMHATFAAQLSMLREEAETKAREEIAQVEKHNTTHVANLVAQHDKALQDMQTYYNQVIHTNLDAIRALKQQLTDATTTASTATRAAQDAQAQVATLTKVLQEAQAQVAEFKGAAQGAARDRAALRRATRMLNKTSAALQQRELQAEALMQRHAVLQEEHDVLRREQEAQLLAVRQQAARVLQGTRVRVKGALQSLLDNGQLQHVVWSTVNEIVLDALATPGGQQDFSLGEAGQHDTPRDTQNGDRGGTTAQGDIQDIIPHSTGHISTFQPQHGHMLHYTGELEQQQVYTYQVGGTGGPPSPSAGVPHGVVHGGLGMVMMMRA